MDALDGLLDGPRARDAFLLRAVLDPPWSILVQDRAPLALVAMTRGGGWAVPDGGEPLPLRQGDIVVARGPDSYLVADAPDRPPQVVVHPGERCMTPDGEDLREKMDQGVRTWGTGADGSIVMLIGAYQMRGEVSRRLLAVLPPLLVLPADAVHSPLVGLLAEEIVKDAPGQEVMLNRLLDLLVIATLRAWFSRPGSGAPAWYQAYNDLVVGRALRLIHNRPAHPWTVASLAAEVGVSRAALARRFTDLVGEPPMTYLTSWRLTLAADLLREPDATVDAVARQVGYGSAFALSTAFKREHGVSPREHRLAAAASP